MAANSRFAVSVHVMTYLAHRAGKPITSAEIASSVNTNPVVVRRILLLLQKARLVSAQKGANGGFSLSSTPKNISLLAIYRASGATECFGLSHWNPNHKCPVGARIHSALEQIFVKAQAGMEAQLQEISLADVANEVSSVCTAKK